MTEPCAREIDVCVIGGGIAGTVLAIALAQRGIQCHIYEESAGRRFNGGALLLWSNATRLLRDLGLGQRVAQRGAALRRMVFRSAAGDVLWDLDTLKLSREAGAPSLVVLRSDLLQLLDEEASRDAQVLPGSFAGLELSEKRVEIDLDHGGRLRSKIAVGADGIHSPVRSQLFPEHPGPRNLGQSIWVGTTVLQHRDLSVGTAIASVGRGRRFWAAALPSGKVAWYAVFSGGERPRDLWELSRLFADWHVPIVDLILAAEASEVFPTTLRDLPARRHWGKGRVTLVGDAIHAVSPDLSQGACQAIESAVALADSLEDNGLVPHALRIYEQQRRARTARIAALSQVTAAYGLPSEQVFCSLRDLGIRWVLPRLAPRELRWVLGSARG